jgi:hypothetical protein
MLVLHGMVFSGTQISLIMIAIFIIMLIPYLDN